MDPILELKKKLGVLQTEIDAVQLKAKDEKRSLTKDEYKSVNDKLDLMDSVEEEIKTLERANERKTRSQGNSQTKDTEDNPGFNANNYQVGNPEEKFRSFGEYLQAVARAALPRGSYISGMQTGVRDRRLYNIGAETRASGMSEAVPSDGGFLVQNDYASDLLKKTHETGLLMSRTRQIPIGANANGFEQVTVDETNRATGSRWGGVQVYRGNEAGTKTGSKPKFGKISLKLEKLYGLCYATDELLQDSAALEAVIRQAFAEEFGFKIDDEIINGTGAGQMLGILNSAALISVAKETGQAADTVVKENIDKMWARLWSRSKANSIWLINQEVTTQLDNLKINVGTGGAPVYLPAGGLSAAPFGTLKGRPILEIEQAAALGDVGDIMLVDLSQYLTIEKGPMQAATSIHVQFLTDETVFRFVMRNNGQPIWDAPLTPYKGTSSTVSPFITLAAR